MGITWVQSSADVQGAINSTIGTVDLYAQYYGAKSFCCGYLDDSVFMWGEEVLLAHQVEVAKGVITYDPSLYVLHMESASVNKISSRKSFKMTKASYKIYRDYYK